MIDQKTAMLLLTYDSKKGAFYWKARPRSMFQRDLDFVRFQKKYAGARADRLHKQQGYCYVKINYKDILAHRLAWLYIHGEWPVNEIDHINHKKTDNRMCNLRSVTKKENGKNQKRKKNCGQFNGVSWNKALKKWHAYISINRKRKHIGFYQSLLDAVAARKRANIKYGFHKNHGH